MPKKLIRQIIKIARLVQELSKFGLFSKKEQNNLAAVLVSEEGGPSPELKLKIYEIILKLKSKIKKPFGLLIVLGWQREWNKKYASLPDISQNIFKNNHFNLANHSLDQCVEVIKKTIDFDGAILVTKEGIIVSSGIYLENMTPKEVAAAIHPQGRVEDLSQAFGFSKKVHTRHLSAIAASYKLKGTTVFVLSEEDGSVRIFEKGRIIWSTIPLEVQKIIKEL